MHFFSLTYKTNLGIELDKPLLVLGELGSEICYITFQGQATVLCRAQLAFLLL